MQNAAQIVYAVYMLLLKSIMKVVKSLLLGPICEKCSTKLHRFGDIMFFGDVGGLVCLACKFDEEQRDVRVVMSDEA